MQIQENFSLLPYNTFAIDSRARYFAGFASADELLTLLSFTNSPLKLVLGGGSNILLTGDVDGLVLKNNIRGIKEIREDEHYIYVRAGAGENWHAFVQYCLQRNWAGVENLSLIPGSVGASPMQNIGAYGVELKDVFFDLEAFHIKEKKCFTFTLNDCAFGYRESVFKKKYKDLYIILAVTFRLRKKPLLHTGYGAIRQELEKMGIQEPGIRDISAAVIRIRQSKLPDPAVIGNAGSFFKNPSVSEEVYARLQQAHPGLVAYPNEDGTYKLAAGWMIEQCGWKGFRRGDAGCHAQQALVLVNYGKASGKDIYQLSNEIQQSVQQKFGITLEKEVNII